MSERRRMTMDPKLITNGLLLWFDGSNASKVTTTYSNIYWYPSMYADALSDTILKARNLTNFDGCGITYNAASKGIYFDGFNYLVSNNKPLSGKTSFTIIIYVKGSKKSTYRKTDGVGFVFADRDSWDSTYCGYGISRNDTRFRAETKNSSVSSFVISDIVLQEPLNVSAAQVFLAGSQNKIATFTNSFNIKSINTTITQPNTSEELLVGSLCCISQGTDRMPYWGNSEGYTICSIVIYERALSDAELKRVMRFLKLKYYN